MAPEPDSPDTSSGERGVFGNLPAARPGVRSPRREGEKRGSAKGAGRTKAAAAKRAARSGAARTASPRTPPSPPPRERTGGAQASHARSSSAQDEAGAARNRIEDVAWAGVTVAAEAATLGVRLLSRGLEAVRERR
jgi:hypothetical protein